MKLTPLRAIKEYCQNQCCAKDKQSWKECSAIKCPLFSFRLGKRCNKPLLNKNTSKNTMVFPMKFHKATIVGVNSDRDERGLKENGISRNQSRILDL